MARPKRKSYSVSGPFTLDPLAAKVGRTVIALQDPRNHVKSNREIAAEIGVDESTVRKYRDLLGLPKLSPCSGRPLPPEPKKPKQTRGKKRSA